MKRRSTRKRAVNRYIGNLERKYELTPADYVRVLLIQDKRCAICGRTREELQQDLVVDHDHTTGVVRGLLCRSCNRTLGVVEDSIERLQRMIDYLTKPPAQRVLRR